MYSVVQDVKHPLVFERPPASPVSQAEVFAQELLAKPAISKADLAHLFSLLPIDTPARPIESSGSKILFGAFRHGGVYGLHHSTRAFPASAAALAKCVRAIAPTFTFDALSLNLNVCTALHRDANNHSDFNLLCPLSDFQHGEVWFASPTGTVPSLDASCNSLGHLLSLRQP